MSRFLQIQIYNSTNTAVEYDNKIDTDWGIQTASANITRKIMQNELSLGNYFANQFEVRIFGLDVNLDGRKVVVTLDYDNVVYNKLIDSDNNYIIDSDNNNIVTTPSTVSASKKLFTGYIDSSKTDITTSYRDLIAYDRAYTDRTIDIASWWNTYWENNTSVTLATFRTALLSEIGVTVATSGSFVNDNITISNTFSGAVSKLNFGDVFKMVCTLQAICPNINGDGNMEFILLGIHTHDIRNNTEGLNSIWEDYQTDYITGVGVYDTSDELAQLVGTADNVYKICGNVFLLDKTANEITTICTNLLNSISSISYTPATLKLIMSDMSYNLGDIVYTANGYSIIMQDKLSGSLLVEETISSYANGITLSDDVDDMNDSIINGNKIAQIKKDIDTFTIDYADFKQDTATQFQQTAEKIVMKVDANGNVGVAELGSDEVDETYMKFKANKVEITSDTIQFDNNGYEVKGQEFITQISPNINDIKKDLSYVQSQSHFFPSLTFPDDVLTYSNKASYILCHLEYSEEDETPPTSVFRTFSNQINCSRLATIDSTELNFTGTVSGLHYMMTDRAYNKLLEDGGYVDARGYVRPGRGKNIKGYLSPNESGIVITGLEPYEVIMSGFNNKQLVEDNPTPLFYIRPSDAYKIYIPGLLTPTSSYYLGYGAPVVIAPDWWLSASGFLNRPSSN